MKHSLLFSLLTLFSLVFTCQINAQRAAVANFAAVNPTPKQKQDLHLAAKRGQKKIALLLPAVQAAREAARYNGPSLQQMTNAYRNKCAYINRMRGNVNGAQYKKLQSDFIKLNKDLDRYIQFHLRQPGGRNLGSRFSECFKDCHESFPGTGGGNGANRFACKLGCFVEASGGRN